jgi:hypothetical protein
VLRKLLICPWFGELPPWMDLWARNVSRLKEFGFDVLLDGNLAAFRKRVRDRLDINCPIVPGEGKIHDYRCAFGVLFEEELEGYDFWGTTDFDCVYGRVEEFVTDEFLDGLDLHSNHVDYVSGPWSLYRNTPLVNTLFLDYHDWEGVLSNPTSTGWVEKQFTKVVDVNYAAGFINRVYTTWQTRNLDDFSILHFDGDRLMEGDEEVMMAHFRRTKVYPEGCK